MEYRGPGKGPLALALTLILILSLFGVGTSQAAQHRTPAATSTGSTFALTASTGFKFDPELEALTSTSVLNASVVVTFTNGDTLAHTFTVASREGWVIPNSYSADALEKFFAAYPPLVDLYANFTGTFTGNFTAPATPGWYEFVCNESGHFQEGMYGFIAFGEALPSNLTVSAASVGPGEAVFIIVGTIVALTVIAIVLGFIVGRRKGSVHEMPPERLGYPEPKSPSEPAPPPGAPPRTR